MSNQRSVTLHLLRHGEALHNVIEWPQQPSADFEASYHDPPLTPFGEEQVKRAQCPKELLEDPNALYFVSPLRRAIQTAIHSMPQEGKKYKVYDCMRERGGGKSCDLRRPRSEIEKWITSLKLSSQWIFEEMEEIDPLNPPVRRESVRDMFPRLNRTLEILNEATQNSDVRNIAIISHSAFLSILMAVLDVCEYKSRWLKNAEWRSVHISLPGVLQIALYKMASQQWLSLITQPTIRPISDTVANAAMPVKSPFPELDRVAVITSDMLSSLAFSVMTNKRSITVLPYPLPTTRNCDSTLLTRVLQGWKPVINDKPAYIDAVTWQSMKDSITPPFVMCALGYVYRKAQDKRISIHEEGLYACSHVVLICQPEKTSHQGSLTDFPVWVSKDYLDGVRGVCESLLDEIGALSVTVVLPHDE